VAKIILTTIGTGGDILPFISIAEALKARGHEPTLVTHGSYASYLDQLGISFVPIDTAEAAEMMISNSGLLCTLPGTLTFYEQYIFPRLETELRHLLAGIADGATLIISRTPAFAARIAAEKTNVPVLYTFMAPAAASGWELTKEFLTSKLGKGVNELRSKVGLAPLSSWSKWTACPRCIGLWPEWFCDVATFSWGDLLLTGFLPNEFRHAGSESQRNDPRELSNQARKVMISAGTGSLLGTDFYSTLIAGCIRAGCTPIVALPVQNNISSEFLNRSIVLRFFSWQVVASAISLICHHGGIGTISQAIRYAIPQVILPQGADRVDNARRIKRLGLGDFESLGRSSVSSTSDLITGVLDSLSIRENCATFSLRIDGDSAVNRICETVEEMICLPRQSLI